MKHAFLFGPEVGWRPGPPEAGPHGPAALPEHHGSNSRGGAVLPGGTLHRCPARQQVMLQRSDWMIDFWEMLKWWCWWSVQGQLEVSDDAFSNSLYRKSYLVWINKVYFVVKESQSECFYWRLSLDVWNDSNVNVFNITDEPSEAAAAHRSAGGSSDDDSWSCFYESWSSSDLQGLIEDYLFSQDENTINRPQISFTWTHWPHFPFLIIVNMSWCRPR